MTVNELRSNLKHSVAELLQELITQRYSTFVEFADVMGTSRQYVANITTPATAPTTIHTITHILSFLDVPLSEFITRVEAHAKQSDN